MAHQARLGVIIVPGVSSARCYASRPRSFVSLPFVYQHTKRVFDLPCWMVIVLMLFNY